jgi:NhaP-type Na+/H+ or K+/H+ antiporter
MSEHSETIQIFFLIFSGLLMVILFLFKFLHDSPRLHSILSEPAMTLLVGMFVSFVVSMFFVLKEERNNGSSSSSSSSSSSWGNSNVESEVEQDLANSILSFQTRVFFLALLPPILFNSGYQLQRELFYRHFGPISLFACVGTCISGFCTGGLLILLRYLGLFGSSFYPTVMELLTFGALIAATDTVSVVGILQAKQVDPHLFSLVFGESALNDAVAIVLFKTLSTFLIQDAFGDSSTFLMAAIRFLAHLSVQAICSPLLGMFYAFCLALAFKAVDLRQHKMLELALYIMPMYIPYMLSEALELSGMIAIFFTGMFAKRYMEPNVSDSTQRHAEMLFKLFAFLAETCIFLELGLSVFGLSGKFQWPFIGCALLTALIGRAASIYPLAAAYNLSLTKRVMVCSTCGPAADDTSIATMDESTNCSVQAGYAGADAGADASSLKSGSSVGGSSWSSRRETPRKRLDKRIPLNFMHMLTFAGLRGAVAYACARDFPNLYGNRDTFVAATMIIVLVTIICMGGATEPLMECLKIRTQVDEQEYMRNWHRQRKLKGRFHRFEYHYIYRLVVRTPPPPTTRSGMVDTTMGTRNNVTILSVEEQDASRIIEHSMTPRVRNTGEGGGQGDSAADAAFDYQYSEGPMMHDDSSGRYLSEVYYNASRLENNTNGIGGLTATTMNDDSNVFNTFHGDGILGRARDHTISFGYTAAPEQQDREDAEAEDSCSIREAYTHPGAEDDHSSLGSSSSASRHSSSPTPPTRI